MDIDEIWFLLRVVWWVPGTGVVSARGPGGKLGGIWYLGQQNNCRTCRRPIGVLQSSKWVPRVLSEFLVASVVIIEGLVVR